MDQDPSRRRELTKQKKWIQTMSVFSSDEEDLNGIVDIQPASECKLDTGPTLALRFPYPMFDDDTDEEDTYIYSHTVLPSRALDWKRKHGTSSDKDDEIGQENHCHKHKKRKEQLLDRTSNKISSKRIASQEEEKMQGLVKDSYNKHTNFTAKNTSRKEKSNSSKQDRKVLNSITTENEGTQNNKSGKTYHQKSSTQKDPKNSIEFQESTPKKKVLVKNLKSDKRHSTGKSNKNMMKRSDSTTICQSSSINMHYEDNITNKKDKPLNKPPSRFLDSSSSGNSDNENDPKSSKSKPYKLPQYKRLCVLSTSPNNSDADDPKYNLEKSNHSHDLIYKTIAKHKSNSKQMRTKKQKGRTNAILSSESEEEKQCPHSVQTLESENEHKNNFQDSEKSVKNNQNLTKTCNKSGRHPFENLIKANENTKLDDSKRVLSCKQKEPKKTILLPQPPNLNLNTNAWKSIANMPLKTSQTKSSTNHQNKIQNLRKMFATSNKSSVQIYKKIQNNVNKGEKLESNLKVKSKPLTIKQDDMSRVNSNTVQLTSAVQKNENVAHCSSLETFKIEINNSSVNPRQISKDKLNIIEERNQSLINCVDNTGENSTQASLTSTLYSNTNSIENIDTSRNVSYPHSDYNKSGNNKGTKVPTDSRIHRSYSNPSTDNNERETTNTAVVENHTQSSVDVNSTCTEYISEGEQLLYKKKVRHSHVDKTNNNQGSLKNDNNCTIKRTKLPLLKKSDEKNVAEPNSKGLKDITTEGTKCDLLSNILSQMDSNPYKIQKPIKKTAEATTSMLGWFPSPQSSSVLAGQPLNVNNLSYTREVPQVKLQEENKKAPLPHHVHTTTFRPCNPSYNPLSCSQRDINSVVTQNGELGNIPLQQAKSSQKETHSIESSLNVNGKNDKIIPVRETNSAKQPEKIISFYSADHEEYTTSSIDTSKHAQEYNSNNVLQVKSSSENNKFYIETLSETRAQTQTKLQNEIAEDTQCKHASVYRIGVAKEPTKKSPLANITGKKDNGEVRCETHKEKPKGIRIRFGGTIYRYAGNIQPPVDMSNTSVTEVKTSEESHDTPSINTNVSHIEHVTTFTPVECNKNSDSVENNNLNFSTTAEAVCKTSSSSEDISSSDESDETSRSGSSEESSSESTNSSFKSSPPKDIYKCSQVTNSSESLSKTLTEHNAEKEKDINVKTVVSPHHLDSRDGDISKTSSKDSIKENWDINNVATGTNDNTDVIILTGSSDSENVEAVINNTSSIHYCKKGLPISDSQSKCESLCTNNSGNGILKEIRTRNFEDSSEIIKPPKTLTEPLTEHNLVHQESVTDRKTKTKSFPSLKCGNEDVKNLSSTNSNEKDLIKNDVDNDVIVLSESSDSENVEDLNDETYIPLSKSEVPVIDAKSKSDSMDVTNLGHCNVGRIRIRSLEELGVTVNSSLPENALSFELATDMPSGQQYSDPRTSSSISSLKVNNQWNKSNTTSSKLVKPKRKYVRKVSQSAIAVSKAQQSSDPQTSSSVSSLNVTESNNNNQLNNMITKSTSVKPKRKYVKKKSHSPIGVTTNVQQCSDSSVLPSSISERNLTTTNAKPVKLKKKKVKENRAKLSKLKYIPSPSIIAIQSRPIEISNPTTPIIAVVKPVNINTIAMSQFVNLQNNQIMPISIMDKSVKSNPNVIHTESQLTLIDKRPTEMVQATSSDILCNNLEENSQNIQKSSEQPNNPEAVKTVFFKLCDELFTDVVLLKIPKLVDDLHLLIASEIMKEERLKKIDQLTSPETIIEEKRRAEKDFAVVLKIRGQSFVPLFATIVSRIRKDDMTSLLTAVYCRIVQHLERIDSVNANYRYKLRNMIRQMVLKQSTEMNGESCDVFSMDDISFITTFEFINNLLKQYDEHKNILIHNSTVANLENIQSEHSRNLEHSDSERGGNQINGQPNIGTFQTPTQMQKPKNGSGPPIGNLDQLFLKNFMKNKTGDK
ncbi:hypothetical protein J6590_005959 [Homalodisca vitripennis]|nr:hypothetical protein J6590_005959 [Homalodisca vitripennis]